VCSGMFHVKQVMGRADWLEVFHVEH